MTDSSMSLLRLLVTPDYQDLRIIDADVTMGVVPMADPAPVDGAQGIWVGISNATADLFYQRIPAAVH
jgi:hypothetical protein